MYNHVIFFYYKFEVSLLGQQKIKESSFSFFLVLNPWLNLSPKKIWLYYWGEHRACQSFAQSSAFYFTRPWRSCIL